MKKKVKSDKAKNELEKIYDNIAEGVKICSKCF